MATIWSLTAITVERAWVIFCITRAKHHRITMAKMMMVVVSIWLAAMIISLPPFLGWNRYIYEGYLYSSTVDYLSTSLTDLSYTWMLMTMGWVLPNLLIMVSHASTVTIYR